MSKSRRDVLKFLGGSAAGLALTPVPWKLLDDVSIWTQTGSLVPRLPKGAVKTRFTSCTLCPAGCPVRARCVGDRPVGLSGVRGNPVSGGGLCPLALAGHHLAYHPTRLTSPVSISRKTGMTTPADAESVAREAAGAIARRPKGPDSPRVVVFDSQPGRSVSALYRTFLGQIEGGTYCVAPGRMPVLGRMLESEWGPCGFDIENARTVLSFGAPLLEVFGGPARAAGLMRSGAADRGGPRIIQVESRRSQTAALAHRWIPVRAGSEAALALGLSHIMLRDALVDPGSLRRNVRDLDAPADGSFRRLVEAFPPSRVAAITGLSEADLAELARQLTKETPSVAVPGVDHGAGPLDADAEQAVWALNALLGSLGSRGGVVPRAEVPAQAAQGPLPMAVEIGDLPDGSVRVLILDGASGSAAVPWSLFARKLDPGNALVVSLSPYLAGNALDADFVVPAPAYLESLAEAGTADDIGAPHFSLSIPLRPAPGGSVEPLRFLSLVQAALGAPSMTVSSEAELLRGRADAIHASGRGQVFTCGDSKLQDLAALGSADDFWKSLNAGAVWIDTAVPSRPLPPVRLLGNRADGFVRLMTSANNAGGNSGAADGYTLALIPCAWQGDATGPVSPVASKLYAESGLAPSACQAALSPETATRLALAEGKGAVVATSAGELRVRIHVDAAVMPGVVQVATGPGCSVRGGGKSPGVHSVCVPTGGRSWRSTPAKVREA